jgi:anaerobic selenocysteine-containing dehydrogenase
MTPSRISRQIKEGDAVRISNDRGAILAGAAICPDISEGVIQISTGAWWDPVFDDGEPFLCRHGSVNALTLDKGTSSLAQGPSALSCLVEMEKFSGELPELTVFTAPPVSIPDGMEP